MELKPFIYFFYNKHVNIKNPSVTPIILFYFYKFIIYTLVVQFFNARWQPSFKRPVFSKSAGSVYCPEAMQFSFIFFKLQVFVSGHQSE